MKNIVILGGSYAGVSTAHRLLKQSAKTGPFKITLVSPNTHFYWNIASPRGVIPGQLTDEQLFQPISAGFDQYPKGQFEFILASAESLNVETKTVEVSGSIEKRRLDYDLLILATGSRTVGDTPFKALGSTEATKDALHDLQARVNKARTIVIAGAGVTGVEVAGELGFECGREKEVILIASGLTVLDESPATVSKTAMEYLNSLNVKVQLGTKVMDSRELPESRQELTLSSGSKIATDLYIPTFGLIPNSSYIPAKFLDARGFVMVDEYLRVSGAEDVWAIGDVSDVEFSQFISCDKQSVYLAKSIAFILSGKTPSPYKVTSSRMGFMGLQVGKKTAVGHFGRWRIPGFIIARARNTLFIERLEGTVDGSLF